MTGKPNRLSILYENKHWLAVNKIAKLSVERSPYGEPTIESLVFDYLSQYYRNPYVGIVHRLDRVTTGVLLFAKRKSALRHINEQFRKKKVRKIYLAIVEKQPKELKATLVNYLWKDREKRKAVVSKTKIKGSVESKLKYKWLGESKDGHLLRIEPFTGKFHQIRVQLSQIGCAILGDEKYGASRISSPDSIALHAWQLSVRDPSTEELIRIKAPLPKNKWWYDFEEILSEQE